MLGRASLSALCFPTCAVAARQRAEKPALDQGTRSLEASALKTHVREPPPLPVATTQPNSRPGLPRFTLSQTPAQAIHALPSAKLPTRSSPLYPQPNSRPGLPRFTLSQTPAQAFPALPSAKLPPRPSPLYPRLDPAPACPPCPSLTALSAHTLISFTPTPNPCSCLRLVPTPAHPSPW